MRAIQILIMKYFKPQPTMHDISIVDKYMDTINDDEAFKYKFFDTVAFDKSFEAHERLAAIDYACGVSGAYTKYLKILAVRCKTHIKPLVGVDFQLCSDGAWRVHLHAVLRSEDSVSSQIAARRVLRGTKLRSWSGNSRLNCHSPSRTR